MERLEQELHMVKAGKGPGDALALVLKELVDLRVRCNKLEAQVKVQDAYLERIKAASNPAW